MLASSIPAHAAEPERNSQRPGSLNAFAVAPAGAPFRGRRAPPPPRPADAPRRRAPAAARASCRHNHQYPGWRVGRTECPTRPPPRLRKYQHRKRASGAEAKEKGPRLACALGARLSAGGGFHAHGKRLRRFEAKERASIYVHDSSGAGVAVAVGCGFFGCGFFLAPLALCRGANRAGRRCWAWRQSCWAWRQSCWASVLRLAPMALGGGNMCKRSNKEFILSTLP